MSRRIGDTPDALAEVRIDLWLWAARFYKTRSLAKQAIEGGKVLVGDAASILALIPILARLVLNLPQTRAAAH